MTSYNQYLILLEILENLFEYFAQTAMVDEAGEGAMLLDIVSEYACENVNPTSKDKIIPPIARIIFAL